MSVGPLPCPHKAYIIYAWASIIPSLHMGGGGGVGCRTRRINYKRYSIKIRIFVNCDPPWCWRIAGSEER